MRKSCPFCGNAISTIVLGVNDDGLTAFAVCDACGACGPSVAAVGKNDTRTIQSATRAWDCRKEGESRKAVAEPTVVESDSHNVAAGQ